MTPDSSAVRATPTQRRGGARGRRDGCTCVDLPAEFDIDIGQIVRFALAWRSTKKGGIWVVRPPSRYSPASAAASWSAVLNSARRSRARGEPSADAVDVRERGLSHCTQRLQPTAH